MRSGRLRALVLSALVLSACGDGGGGGPTQPNPKDLSIAIQGGDDQVWTPGQPLPKPLQVVVKNAASKDPVKGVSVSWTISGGGSVNPATSVTDSSGIAETTVTLGSALTTYTVTANFTGNIGPAATFKLEATSGATITGVSPASVRAGDTVTVTGTGFSTVPEHNNVLFGGVRGAVAAATATQLKVVVPLCGPTGSVSVVVVLGPTTSGAASLSISGGGATPLALAVGQVSVQTDPGATSCVRLQGGASYLLVVQNATDVSDRPMSFQLLGLGAGSTSATGTGFATPRATVQAALATDFATEFETRLREQEAQLVESALAQGGVPRAELAAVGAAIPAVGDTSTFSVLNTITGNPAFTTVRAVVKLVSNSAIIYQDVNAPGGGFANADFQQFGALFDDPIYPTDVAVFGPPSDVDANQHVVILFTPVVNAMSPKGSASFVAGFFYGCDLLSKSQCSGTNRAEVFYASVPDPSGTQGPVLSKTRIMQTTPAVLAHEFMHMIHFNQRVLLRNTQDDALWMDEALAHTAEDTVGGVFLQRGDTANAIQFVSENWRRANNYLSDTEGTSLLAFTPPGTLAERGAGWLFLKYLRGRFGGGILKSLVQTTLSSTANVSSAAGLGWTVLINDWTVALWADDAPELAGAALDPRYTFRTFDLRRILGQPAFGGVYLLQPTTEPFTGFNVSNTVLSSTAAYYTVTGAAGAAPLSLNLAAPRGLPFTGGVVPQLAVLRYK